MAETWTILANVRKRNLAWEARRMTRLIRLFGILTFFMATVVSHPQSSRFHVLAFYSTTVEQDHVDFAQQAIPFFQDLAKREHFTFNTTTDWNNLNPEVLARYQVVVWLDDRPSTPAQQAAFANYME